MKTFIFTWSIENISYSWHKTGETIVSPIFFAGPMQNTAWTLRLYPRGVDDSDDLSLYLYREKDQVPKDIAVSFLLSCVSADTSELNNCFTPKTFTTFEKGVNSGFGRARFMKRHEVFDRRKDLYSPRDILTLRCRMWKEGDSHEFGQSSARTHLKMEQIFSVENIYLENAAEETFHIQSKQQNKALISISVLYNDDKIDVRINPISTEEMKSSSYKLSFVDRRTGSKLCELVSRFLGKPQAEVWRLPFSDKVLHTENDDFDGSNFDLITEIFYSTGEENKMIEEGCEIRFSEFLSNYIMSCVFRSKLKDYPPSISDDLWNLYTKHVLCDVELKTQSKSFFAHKTVLCARSPAFLTILTGKMKKKKKKCIEIEQIKADTLDKFLNFLYTDAFKDYKWDAVIELYYTASKYQVERLRLLCCSYLLKNVSVHNVCELLMLADRHHDCELKKKVDDFIWKNEEKIFKSSLWKKFAYEQPQLALKSMLSKYEEKEDTSPAESYDDRISRHPSVLDDFRSLYQGQIANDIVIKTKGTTFPAHKTVLCASSSTFKNMLLNDLRYKSTAVIEIEDLEDDTVSRMLFFLYTDSFEDIQWNTALKLYHAAIVYQIQRLKMKCSCFLLKGLRVSNAVDLLLLAHEHRDDQLKSVVEDYITVYDEELFASDEWAKFSKTNLLLANEIMRTKYKKMEGADIRTVYEIV